MVKVKTSELTGAALDWVLSARLQEHNAFCMGTLTPGGGFSPSTNWAQGGPIVEREGIAVLPPIVRRIAKERHAFPVDYWRAMIQQDENEPAIHGKGDTPLIAAMRCYVASKLGDEVDVPEELL